MTKWKWSGWIIAVLEAIEPRACEYGCDDFMAVDDLCAECVEVRS